MSWKGIQALDHSDSQQRNVELPLVGKRMRMSMTETLSHRLEAIKLHLRKHRALASNRDIPARESTISGGEESRSVGDHSHSESYA